MTEISMLVPAALLFGAFLLKLPALIRHPQDILLASVCGLLLMAGLLFSLAAVPTLAAINRVSGIPNLAAPLFYSALTAVSCACLVLLTLWRDGVTPRTRRLARRCALAYGSVAVSLNVLFVLGDASTERLRDFDTYYATTPYIRELIVLYLLAHTVASVVTAVFCWRWSRLVTGVPRAGLALIGCGYLLNLGYDTAKLAAVGARWAGQDWDRLGTELAPPLAALGAPLIGGGFVLPLLARYAGDGRRAALRYLRLGPLARLLRRSAPPGSSTVAIGRWAPLELRLIRREAAIHDGIIGLRPYYDEGVYADALARALAEGQPPERARVIADAAMIAAAGRARAAEPGRTAPVCDGSPLQPASGPDDLVRISRALRGSPLVHEVHRRALSDA
ncbi:MAB_1171c family putative transporter [Streptomyces sp. NPDC000594]|uniref:MAB_1171c family putative transporter n=1 Tax=Streptomyces sp. NPDC000594 TaxID=3154261 RepID=UPI003327F0F9